MHLSSLQRPFGPHLQQKYFTERLVSVYGIKNGNEFYWLRTCSAIVLPGEITSLA